MNKSTFQSPHQMYFFFSPTAIPHAFLHSKNDQMKASFRHKLSIWTETLTHSERRGDSHTFRKTGFNEPQGTNWVRRQTEKCAQSKY